MLSNTPLSWYALSASNYTLALQCRVRRQKKDLVMLIFILPIRFCPEFPQGHTSGCTPQTSHKNADLVNLLPDQRIHNICLCWWSSDSSDRFGPLGGTLQLLSFAHLPTVGLCSQALHCSHFRIFSLRENAQLSILWMGQSLFKHLNGLKSFRKAKEALSL